MVKTQNYKDEGNSVEIPKKTYHIKNKEIQGAAEYKSSQIV